MSASCRVQTWLVNFLSLLAACGGDGNDALWTLRPNTVEVYGAANTVEGNLAVVDADRDGDRIALVRLSSGGLLYVYLDLSDDLGRTWRSLQVRKAVSELGGDSFQIGVHLEHGKVYLMLSRDIGSSWPAFAIFDVDTTTGETTEVVFYPPVHTGWFTERQPDGKLWYMKGHGFHSFVTLDPATGAQTWKEVPCTGMACTVPTFRSLDGGATWDGYSQADGTHDVCRLHYDVATDTASQLCVHRPSWPSVEGLSVPVIMFRGTTPYSAWSTEGQAYATALVSGATSVSETLQLGPGVIDTKHRTGNFVRPRFAEFELVDSPDYFGNLARLTDNGAEWVVFPFTPCVADNGCGYGDSFFGPPTYGYGQLQWLLPTDQGDYLAFYTMMIDSEGKQALYMTHEVPTFAPVVGGAPPPDRPIELPAGAQPMNELEKACALHANCIGHDTTIIYSQCLKRWTTESATRPGVAAGRTRFLAAATSCASLNAIAASGCTLECTESGGTCGGGGIGPCSTSVPYVAGNCFSCTGNGGYVWCPDGAQAFEVACGGGTVCSPGWGCALTGTLACEPYAPYPACEGDTVRNCDDASKLLTYTDCGLQGGVCNATTGTCAPATSGGTCTPAEYMTECASATHLLTCAYGQIQYTACSDWGYTECVAQAGGAICH
ncbi:MAG: hypothetical protein SFX73_12440 [Kofleriaceae bacterium]|nr:hypothetical protein [Kofleriaceae bacterium]